MKNHARARRRWGEAERQGGLEEKVGSRETSNPPVRKRAISILETPPANSPLPIAHYPLPTAEQGERFFPCLSIGDAQCAMCDDPGFHRSGEFAGGVP